MTSQTSLRNRAKRGITNRGEAALRFIRAVSEYNSLYRTELRAASLFTPMEEYAPFSKMADEAFPLAGLSGYPGNQKRHGGKN